MALARLSPTAGTTVDALARNVIRQLADVPYEDSHSSAPNATDTSLTVAADATARYRAGQTVEWLIDGSYERARITAVAATTLTIRRGSDFTTAATHLANAVFRLDPRFWATNVVKAVNDAIDADLFPELYAVYEETLTAAPTTTYYYAVDASAEEILRVYQKTDSTTPQDLDFLVPGQPEYVDSTLATSKRAVYIPYLADTDNTIFAQFLTRIAVGDLSAGMARIVEASAIARLLGQEGGSVARSEDTRQSGSMTPGQAIRDSRYWFAVAEDLRRREHAVLEKRWPRKPKNRMRAPHIGDYADAHGTGHGRWPN